MDVKSTYVGKNRFLNHAVSMFTSAAKLSILTWWSMETDLFGRYHGPTHSYCLLQPVSSYLSIHMKPSQGFSRERDKWKDVAHIHLHDSKTASANHLLVKLFGRLATGTLNECMLSSAPFSTVLGPSLCDELSA